MTRVKASEFLFIAGCDTASGPTASIQA